MKNVELRLISELVKNCRRSDRELSRALGVSQPTVSRMIKNLEEQGIVKEYTMIPDFHKLGYEIMAFTFLKYEKQPTEETLKKIREKGRELEKTTSSAAIMIMSGMGPKSDRVIISFHKNYSSLANLVRIMRGLSNYDISYVDSFIVSTGDKTHSRPLTLTAFASQLASAEQKKL